MDDPTGRYHDVLVYTRELTEQELKAYELGMNKTDSDKMTVEAWCDLEPYMMRGGEEIEV